MNTSSRVPGITRNTGWQAIDAEIAVGRRHQQRHETTCVPVGDRRVPALAGSSS